MAEPSEWAKDTAGRLFVYDSLDEWNKVARALDAARKEALEEAVRTILARSKKVIGTAHERRLYSIGCREAAADVCALIDKPPAPLADGWITWAGGDCPLPPGSWFEYRCRNGGTGAPLTDPTAWTWHHSGGPFDIIAYRVSPADG